MGEVKEEIKGSAPKRKARGASTTLLANVKDLCDEVSELARTKDDEVFSEPDKADENKVKAAKLRAVHALFTGARNLLEDY